MATYTSRATGDWNAESTWNAGGPTTGYVTPGYPQPITSTSSGTGGGVRVTLTTAPSAGTVWVAGDIATIAGVTTGTEANGQWAVVNISGATFEIVPRKTQTWSSGGTAVRSSDSASSTITGVTAVSGGIQLTLSGVATTWAVGDVVTVSGIAGTSGTETNGVWVVRVATNVTNSTIDLAVRWLATGAGSGTAVRGDIVTNAAAYTVTITGTDAAVGKSGSAYDFDNSGTLVIAAGRKLTLRSNAYNYKAISAGAGSILEFDCPVGQTYIMRAYLTTGTALSFIGTSGSKAVIKSTTTTRQGQIVSYAALNAVVYTFVDFQYANHALAGNELSVVYTDCTFTGLSTTPIIQSASPGATGKTLTLLRVTTTGTTASLSMSIKTGSYTGTRSATDCSFDQPVSSGDDWYQWTFSRCAINVAGTNSGQPIQTPGTGGQPWTTVDGCLLRTAITGSGTASQVVTVDGDITNSILWLDASLRTNWNACQIKNTSPTTLNLNGNLWTSNHGDNNGALFYCATTFSNTANTINCKNNIVLPNTKTLDSNPTTPRSVGTLFNTTGFPAGNSAYIEHNTFCVDGAAFPGAITMGDQSGVCGANSVKSVRGNIGWSAGTVSGRGWLYTEGNGILVNDVVSPANIGFNGGLNLPASTSVGSTNNPPTVPGYGSYTAFFFSSAINGNTTDVTGDPNFVDRTRNLNTAYTSFLAQTTTGTAAGDAQAAITQIGADVSKIATIRDWIRAGFAIRNASMNKTFSGDTNAVTNMGAVQGVFGGVQRVQMEGGFTSMLGGYVS